MIRSLILLAVLSFPFMVMGQTVVTFTPPSPPQSGASASSASMDATAESFEVLVGGYASIGVQVTGTWAGTLTFGCTVNGTTWVTYDLSPSTGTTAVSSTTANGAWSANVGGVC